MLIGQATINFLANVLSALLGLLSVYVFTRLFAPYDYGIYVLGVGFASVISTFFVGWFRNLILREHGRNDGTDIRGLVIPGYLIACLTGPVAYGLGRLVGLDVWAAVAATALAITVGFFEVTQDLLRARLLAKTVMKATLVRALLVLCLGASVAMFERTGFILLASSTLAFLIATAVQSRVAWLATVIRFDRPALLNVAKQGLPITLSLVLLAISSVIDRFMLANLVGTADAGKYIAGLDLVRQTAMMPAMSAAAAFFPLAVQIHANQGTAAVQSHLSDCLELLLGITLPACLGFAVISSHVANVVLGVDFREIAAQTMPIVAVAVIFQILTQQYLHASFLLSGRNSFYLINTASIIVANALLSYVLISKYSALGAAWARLGADVFGFACALVLSRRAFALPFSLRALSLTLIAGLAMALIVVTIDKTLAVSDLTACVILVSAGAISYALLCWLLDISRTRDRSKLCLGFVRSKLANTGPG